MKSESNLSQRLPPGQQLVAPGKWPLVGERLPRKSDEVWRLKIVGRHQTEVALSLDQLAAMPQVSQTMDIHCVTRWSKYDVTFSGVLLEKLLELVDVRGTSFASFVARSERNHSSSMSLSEAIDLQTMIALQVDGQPLSTEHGGPLRSVVPRKYFYKSVKWLERIDLLAEDRLGFWEAETGYHNNADPWLEQRFVASKIDKRKAAELIQAGNFSGLELLSLDISGRDLKDLNAESAQLRNANFNQCGLAAANFKNANLSNARFRGANLVQADFRGADLEGADFAGANLSEADLTDCSLFGTSFCDGQESGETSFGAAIDGSTRIDEEQLEALTPLQVAYVVAAKSGVGQNRH